MSSQLPPQMENKLKEYEKLQVRYQKLEEGLQLLQRKKQELEASIKELEQLPEDSMVFKTVGRIMFKQEAGKVLQEYKDEVVKIEQQVKLLDKQLADTRQKIQKIEQELSQFMRSRGLMGVPPSGAS